MNILVAVDLSAATEKILEAARGVAEISGVSMHVLHVIESEPDYIGYDVDSEFIRGKVAEDFPLEHRGVQTLAEKLQDDGFDATALLACGPAVATTLKKADSLKAGLIVVGTHGHGAVYDVLIGSYSAGIIRKSRLPVLIVPIREA